MQSPCQYGLILEINWLPFVLLYKNKKRISMIHSILAKPSPVASLDPCEEIPRVDEQKNKASAYFLL